MPEIYSDTKKVLASNEGDAFHVVWTARRCLKLLNLPEKLQAVIVEGISPTDISSRGGILKADTTEYYGGETFDKSHRFIMSQLKYSPTNPNKEWTASGIIETFSAFAEDFKKKYKAFGKDAVKQKAEYVFVTNRPISKNLLEALKITSKSPQSNNLHVTKALMSLKRSAKLSDAQYDLFITVFRFQAREKERAAQEWELNNSILGYLPGDDSAAQLRLEKLIRDRTLITGNGKPIKVNDVLQALNVASVERLLPAPPSQDFQLPKKYVPRIQENEIVDIILKATNPIIVHASGGVGKSAFALRLPKLMPKGSQSIVFDGFADGLYRQPSNPRHQHSWGLVQIANELAFNGLCDPLLPSPHAKRADFLQAFIYRLAQAVKSLKQKAPDAILLIVLDAADNSQQAAQADPANTPSFAKDLLKETLPAGCRLVLFARTERYDLLSPPAKTTLIQLHNFTLSETALLLNGFYRSLDDESIKEFYRMTNANPRVQLNALREKKTFHEMMQALGPNPLSVNDTISLQLKQALEKIKEESVSVEQIERLCVALAVLPPLVPIDVLSKAANINEALVHSFVNDFGHYLMERDDSIHFRDEPVDNWFRESFCKPEKYEELITSLKLIHNNTYVSLALPEILWLSGKIDDLMALATSDDGLPDNNPVERRRIVLRRVQFSLKAAIQKKRYADVIKLSMRAGEEVAGNEREATLLLVNHDLVSTLMGAKRAQEIVFRYHADKWLGSSFAYGAAILATEPNSIGEARHMLRIAEDWVLHWSKLDKEERESSPITEDDIVAIHSAHLLIHGPKKMVLELSRWSPKTLAFRVSKHIASKLVDLGNFKLIEEIAAASEKNPYIILGLTFELAKVGRTIKKEVIHKAIKSLLLEEKIKLHDFSWQGDHPQEAIIGLIESGSKNSVPTRTLLRLINLYIPPIPKNGYDNAYNKDRNTILRYYSIKAALQRKNIELIDVAQEDLHSLIKSENTHSSTSDMRDFNEVIGILLPWHKLRAEIITNNITSPVIDQIQNLQKVSLGKFGYGGNKIFVSNELSELWMDILVLSENATEECVSTLLSWIKNSDSFFYYPTRISLARTIATSSNATDKSYKLLKDVYEECLAERESASSRVETITSISRAIISLNKNEAIVYFDSALDLVNRFGDEIYEQWRTISLLAEKASDPQKPNAKLSYEYVREAELLSEYISDKFPWHEVIENASLLCHYSGFTLLSRLYDRDKGWIGDLLPALVMSLNKRNIVSASVCAALTVFNGHWNREKISRRALIENKELGLKIFDQLSSDAIIFEDSQDIKNLNKVLKEYNIQNKSLENSEKSFDLSAVDRSYKDDNNKNPKEINPTVDWNLVLSNFNFLNSAEIDSSYIRLKSYRPYYPIDQLFQEMRKRVPDGKEKDHIIAILKSSELNDYEIMSGLEGIKEFWNDKLTIKKYLKEAAVIFLEQSASSLLGSTYAINDRIEKLQILTGLAEPTLIDSLLKGVSLSVNDVSAHSFFVLSNKLAQQLDVPEAINVFEYALLRLKPELTEDDGDGEWDSNLQPPENIHKTVAGFLYLCLGHPKAEIRWKSAHAIVRLCRFGEDEIISSLIELLPDTGMDNFHDSKLLFYQWNARLYLMIALSRASKEYPIMLWKHKDVFLKWAMNDPKHVLIRHFSSQVVLSLYKNNPESFNPSDIENISNINISIFPQILKDETSQENFAEFSDVTSEDSSEDSHYFLPHDFDTDWLAPLCNIFGISNDSLAIKIKKLARMEGKRQFNGKWDDDPRGKKRYYHDLNTSCRYGEHPEVDTLSFYLSYHSLCIMAAELIDTKPTIKEEGWSRDWNDWLAKRLLTRADGYWLFDRRDPRPLELRRWQIEPPLAEHYREWKWSILSKDFLDVIVSNENKNRITLHGKWNISNGSYSEDITVRSAVVSSANSTYLLRALQNMDSSDFFIPTSNHEMEINEHGFNMHGWVSDLDTDLKLDELDILAGKTPWPSLRPSKRTCRFLKLHSSADGRNWQKDNLSVIFSESWGDRREDRHESARNYGARLSVSANFAIDSLKEIDRDLIIQVQIEREHGKEDDHVPYKHKRYSKIYLLRQDGRLCSLFGDHLFWREDNSGINPEA